MFGLCGRGRLARESLKSKAAGESPATTRHITISLEKRSAAFYSRQASSAIVATATRQLALRHACDCTHLVLAPASSLTKS